jgi:hypothetical protein
LELVALEHQQAAADIELMELDPNPEDTNLQSQQRTVLTQRLVV